MRITRITIAFAPVRHQGMAHCEAEVATAHRFALKRAELCDEQVIIHDPVLLPFGGIGTTTIETHMLAEAAITHAQRHPGSEGTATDEARGFEQAADPG
ncbi:MAG: hypothetical protein IPK99_02820 [Flavobacteriales bacterium]|nr:hypothetical protein [Flavobacteriales bacterium]